MLTWRRRSVRRRAVEIGSQAPGTAGSEAFVEGVHRRDAQVEVHVLLSDGNSGVAQLDATEWDWLDMQTGDILLVRPPACRALNA
jgi:hypothetical protein